VGTLEPVFFESPAAMGRWLAKNHRSAKELLVGFHKRHTGRPSLTWPESVDEALCFGWIDGVRRSLGAEGYTIRFTPRKAGSIWSAVNLKKVAALVKAGKMKPAGLAAFRARSAKKTAVYAYENRPKALDRESESRFRKNARAWTWFRAQAPWYRRTAAYWVMSAKKDETRERRLAILIASSAKGEKAPPYRVGRES
jgi:uncharacterized protein YdeI (YjbR/CyaY-like superfamily)